MMTLLILNASLALSGSREAAWLMGEASRLPPHDLCNRQHSFATAYVSFLTGQLVPATGNCRANLLWQLQEAQGREFLWELAELLTRTESTYWERLYALLTLKDCLGADYPNLPAPVPLHHFPERD